jgi:hypothetical protein
MIYGSDGFSRPDVQVQFLTDGSALILLHYTGLVQALNPHKFVQLCGAHAPIDETELAGLVDLTCRGEKAGHGGAIERGCQTDAANAGRSKLRDGERFSSDAHHEVYWLGHCRTDCPDRGEVGQAWRGTSAPAFRKPAGAGWFRQAWVEKKVVCPAVSGRKQERPYSLHGCGDTFDRQRKS